MDAFGADGKGDSLGPGLLPWLSSIPLLFLLGHSASSLCKPPPPLFPPHSSLFYYW